MTDDDRPRIRDLGVQPGRLPTGPNNALTDLPSVAVGHETLLEGGPDDPPCVRTGVTAVLPHGEGLYRRPVSAAVHVSNGFGKSTGLAQVRELGELETPVVLTNTLSVWRVADAVLDYVLDRNPDARSVNPVVGECNDGRLNDIRGRHVRERHVRAALDSASGDEASEGVVGAGTGTIGYGWKAGIGTSSRTCNPAEDDEATVGALVLTNTGTPERVRAAGHPVGDALGSLAGPTSEGGSIMMLVGTDAPLSSRQLGRVARRAPFGLARTGSTAAHGSGDFAVAFSTRHRDDAGPGYGDGALDPLFEATVEAVEEAILNSVLRARTVVGRTVTARAIPVDELAAALD